MTDPAAARPAPEQQVGVPEPGDAAALDRLLATRWSCRAFTDEPVPHETVVAVLETAARTPSWCNTQPWHVHVVTGDALARFTQGIQEAVLTDHTEKPDLPFPGAYEGVHRDRRRASGWQLYDAVGIERGDRTASAVQAFRNFELFGAPALFLVTTEAVLGTYGAVDCGLFLDSLLLALHAHGLGAVAQAALASQAPFVREFLGLSEERLVLAGVSFGYADLAHPANGYRTARQPLGELATFVS